MNNTVMYRLNTQDEMGAWYVAKEVRTDADGAMRARADVMDAAIDYPGEYVMLERYEYDERRMAYSRTKCAKIVVPMGGVK